ncbi:MAG: glycosyltransferase family 2 protein [Bacteroidia bacterium]
MPAISAVIIAYNEEKKIAQCINSVKNVADEVVVVDSFSSDNTAAICSQLGAKVIQHAFEGYIEQKNFALTQAANNFVLSLDADEALSDELASSILRVKNNWDADGYTMNRLTSYCDKWIYHCGWYPDKKLRLFDKTKTKWGGVNPHDKAEMIAGAKTKHLNGDILHFSFDSEEEFLVQQKKFAGIAAQHMHRLKKTSNFFHIYLKPTFKFLRDYILRLGILDGKHGFVISKISAHAVYLKYAKLRELNRSH